MIWKYEFRKFAREVDGFNILLRVAYLRLKAQADFRWRVGEASIWF